MKKYETASKPGGEIAADIEKPAIKMTKVFRGCIDGKSRIYLPGQTVTGKDAEYIKSRHPAWCETSGGIEHIGGPYWKLSNGKRFKGSKEEAIAAERGERA
jgi:hypothetical protein